jgi:3-phosphoshikimate 1-carboxyvinyltransferase
MSSHNLNPLFVQATNAALLGEVIVPGDKSISHRSLIFATLAIGVSKISGLLEGEDVLKTAAALRKMGAVITKEDNGTWLVNGVGIGGLTEPDDILDMGNSGTSTRLLMGLLAPFNFTSFFTGDASLRNRPMQRVFDPIKQIGAKIVSRQDNLLPAAIIGAANPLAINYKMKVASAQIKSAILLAALNIPGTTTIIEPDKCRDHTEIMMRHLGIDISVEDMEIDGKIGSKISLKGGTQFAAKDFSVPGDISSAAFLIVAALITPDSKIKINNVAVNPLRDGIIKTLKEMGGKIELKNSKVVNGEKVADILVEYSVLKGIAVPSSRAPSMIDEYPILAIAAANAQGTTIMKGLAELKVKESNRLSAIAQGLEQCGCEIKTGSDYLQVAGGIRTNPQKIKIKTFMDHRIAMAFLIMGSRLGNGLEIDDSTMIDTSFPGFTTLFADLGINFKKITHA